MNKKGFTLVEIMIVVAIIGLLAAIAIPSFMKSRTVSQANSCINNLRQIESGKEQAAMALGLADAQDAPVADVNSYIRGGAPTCPVAGNTYGYNAIGTVATCSDAGAVDGALHVLTGYGS